MSISALHSLSFFITFLSILFSFFFQLLGSVWLFVSQTALFSGTSWLLLSDWRWPNEECQASAGGRVGLSAGLVGAGPLAVPDGRTVSRALPCLPPFPFSLSSPYLFFPSLSPDRLCLGTRRVPESQWGKRKTWHHSRFGSAQTPVSSLPSSNFPHVFLLAVRVLLFSSLLFPFLSSSYPPFFSSASHLCPSFFVPLSDIYSTNFGFALWQLVRFTLLEYIAHHYHLILALAALAAAPSLLSTRLLTHSLADISSITLPDPLYSHRKRVLNH